MDSGITKLRKRSPTTDVHCDGGRRAMARAERVVPRLLTTYSEPVCLLLEEKLRAREHRRETKGVSGIGRRINRYTFIHAFTHSTNHVFAEYRCCTVSQTLRAHSGASRRSHFSQEGVMKIGAPTL